MILKNRFFIQIFLTLLIVAFVTPAFGYDNHSEIKVMADRDWLQIGNQRLAQQDKAMWILLGWGSLNLAGGSLLALNRTHRDFYIMMAGWGLVNAGIAAFSLLSPEAYDSSTLFSQVLKDEQLFNRILSINSGLNIGYIATGFCMASMGKSTRIRQFGTAIMIQGAFLAVFDTVLLLDSISRLNNLSIIPFALDAQSMLPQNQWITGVGVSFRF